MEWLTDYPLVVASCLFCFYPGVAFLAGGFLFNYVGKRGGLPRLSWPDESTAGGDDDE